jgi:UDP-2,3-diacylglucosamine pyrophosphatase LpxH
MGNPAAERTYFDPERWDGAVANHPPVPDDDPVAANRGRVEGRGTAILFLSDFHLADGTAGGDDFLESHLRREDASGGLFAGFFPPGESRAGLVLSAVTLARRRVAAVCGPGATLDVVLNGDVIDFLALRGRGGTYVSPRHAPLFRALAALAGRSEVVWLRGNHDHVVPEGPWRRGEFFVHPGLRVLAEHGDFWDKSNWPPGTESRGSRLVLEMAGSFEVRGSVMKGGQVLYLMSGLDNVRPLSDGAINSFLDRRAKYSDVAATAAALARLKFVGSADDSAAYKGALKRRKSEDYRDWLMVQGHTHVPAAVPGAYYNLGTWISTLVGRGRRKEEQIEAFPFLLTYPGAGGERVEEYFVARRPAEGGPPTAVLHSAEMVDELRAEFGYDKSDA